MSQRYHCYVEYVPHVGIFWTDYKVRVICFNERVRYALFEKINMIVNCCTTEKCTLILILA